MGRIADFWYQIKHEGYNQDGFNKYGWDREGYNRDGYNFHGYNRLGYSTYGYNQQGYDKEGYYQNGYHRITGLDKQGFRRDGFGQDGYDKEGNDREGYSIDGFNKKTRLYRSGTAYDSHGYDIDGYDVNGFTQNMIHKNGTFYDGDGYDICGYNSSGYDILGYDICGYNSNGYDIFGFDADGRNEEGTYSIDISAETFEFNKTEGTEDSSALTRILLKSYARIYPSHCSDYSTGKSINDIFGLSVKNIASYSSSKNDGYFETDIHGLTKKEAKSFLQHLVNNIYPEIEMITIIHGYHSGQKLMEVVRKEVEHPRIYRKIDFNTNAGRTDYELVVRSSKEIYAEEEDAIRRKRDDDEIYF